jgi:ATP-binding cassette subfamily F protein uup
LDGNRSVSDNLADRAGVVKLPNGATQPVVVYLSRFGFSAEDQRRDAASLSGGERNRLLLAKAMLQPADLLVLDEPTNDLDIPTLQNLEEALQGFPGALLLVSHDRFFLDQVATHTFAWNPNGDPRWELYEGPPDTVRSLRAQRAATAVPKAEAPKAAAKTEAPKAKKPGLSQKEQRRYVEVEQAMEQLHVRIAHLDALLADPAAFLTADAPGHQALKDREAAKSNLEMLEMEWLELEEKKAL